MQLAVIEYARHVAGLAGATTHEISKDAEHLIVTTMESQKDTLASGKLGGTMRLGAWEAYIGKDTLARAAYGSETVSERHRHRYEVNSTYVPMLEKAGLVFSGKSPDGSLCEIAELPQDVHPFFLGTQFHPEFKSRPLAPHKLFLAFVEACIKTKK
jgi:CTP synthase